jgi:hypothetical protein
MAARQSNLRAVPSRRTPKTVEPKTVTEAAGSGSKLEFLIAMRDRIARTVDKPDCPPRELAALTKRLQDLSNDIEALEAALAGSRRTAAQQPNDNADDDRFDPTAI